MCGKCNHEHGMGTSCANCGCGSEAGCKMCGTSMGSGHALRCSKHVCAKLLWVLGVVALVGAWVADRRGAPVWGFTADHLFHDAIAFLVLAVSLKLMKKRGGHGCCK